MSKRVSNKSHGGGARTSRTWRQHQIKALKRRNAELQEAIAAEAIRMEREKHRQRPAVKPPSFVQRVKSFFRRRAFA